MHVYMCLSDELVRWAARHLIDLIADQPFVGAAWQSYAVPERDRG